MAGEDASLLQFAFTASGNMAFAEYRHPLEAAASSDDEDRRLISLAQMRKKLESFGVVPSNEGDQLSDCGL